MEKFFEAVRKKRTGAEPSGSGDLPLIAGLGNPGREYRETRHNVGFMVIDRLAEKLGVSFQKEQLKGLTATGNWEGHKVLLVKPQTFMNESGRSVVPLMHYFKIPQDRLFVIHDDMDIPFSHLRVRPNGSNGGQKGVGSIIGQLGSQEFCRLRCGIGHPTGQMDVKDYVLSKFSREEEELLNIVLDRASDCVLDYLSRGFVYAMNHYNGPVER